MGALSSYKVSLQIEKEVFGLRNAFQTLLKKGQDCHVVEEVLLFLRPHLHSMG